MIELCDLTLFTFECVGVLFFSYCPLLTEDATIIRPRYLMTLVGLIKLPSRTAQLGANEVERRCVSKFDELL